MTELKKRKPHRASRYNGCGLSPDFLPKKRRGSGGQRKVETRASPRGSRAAGEDALFFFTCSSFKYFLFLYLGLQVPIRHLCTYETPPVVKPYPSPLLSSRRETLSLVSHRLRNEDVISFFKDACVFLSVLWIGSDGGVGPKPDPDSNKHAF